MARSGLALVPPQVQDFHTGGDRIGLLEALARAETCAGQEDEAWPLLQESMELRLRFGVRQHQCENLEMAAALLAREGHFTVAAQALRAAAEARRENSNPCLPFLRRFATEAQSRIPSSLLTTVPCLPLDAAVAQILKSHL